MFHVIQFLVVAAAAIAVRGSPAGADAQNPPIGATFTGGSAAFFFQEGGTGSCGNKNPDSAVIAAVEVSQASQANCGRKLLVTNTANGKEVVVTIADTCPSCTDSTSGIALDLSIGAFDAIGDEASGLVPVKYTYLS